MVRKKKRNGPDDILHHLDRRDNRIIQGCILGTGIISLSAAFFTATSYTPIDLFKGNIDWSLGNIWSELMNNKITAGFFAVMWAIGAKGNLFTDHGKMIEGMDGLIPITREEKPELHDMIVDISKREGLDKTPRMYMMASHGGAMFPPNVINAAALGNSKSGAVMFTSNIEKELSPSQVEGVVAHEIEHISRAHTYKKAAQAVMARPIQLMFIANLIIVLPLSTVVSLFSSSSFLGFNGADFGFLAFAMVATTYLNSRISLAAERQADRGASNVTGNPWALADGLEQIVELANPRLFSRGLDPKESLIKRFLKAITKTHPDVPFRLERLRNFHFPALAKKYGKEKLEKTRMEYLKELEEFKQGKEQKRPRQLTGSDALLDLLRELRKRTPRFVPGSLKP